MLANEAEQHPSGLGPGGRRFDPGHPDQSIDSHEWLVSYTSHSCDSNRAEIPSSTMSHHVANVVHATIFSYDKLPHSIAVRRVLEQSSVRIPDT